MAPTRLTNHVPGTKRPLSPESNSPVTKRVEKESFWETSAHDENEPDHHVSVDWDSTTWQESKICDPSINRLTSRNCSEDKDEEGDVKYDPAYLDTHYESLLAEKNMKQSKEFHGLHQHDASDQTYINDRVSPSPSSPPSSAACDTSPTPVPTSPYYSPLPTKQTVSPLWLPSSPTRYESSEPLPSKPLPLKASPLNLSSPSRRTFESAVELFNRRNSIGSPPSPPRLEPLSSPCISSPAPMFFPQLSPRNDSPKANHQPDFRNILRGNKLGDLANIVPSTADDVFTTMSSLETRPSILIKRKHDTWLPLHVRNPAKGVVAKWVVVAQDRRRETIGYPCEDHKFRTEKRKVLATWDKFGNIRDLEGNIVR